VYKRQILYKESDYGSIRTEISGNIINRFLFLIFLTFEIHALKRSC